MGFPAADIFIAAEFGSALASEVSAASGVSLRPADSDFDFEGGGMWISLRDNSEDDIPETKSYGSWLSIEHEDDEERRALLLGIAAALSDMGHVIRLFDDGEPIPFGVDA